jgi:hypothetical protein
MLLPAPIDLKEWFNDSVEDYLSIAPTSTSPQPVHVLNGFFHNALTGRRSARTAIDAVATRGGKWAKSAGDLRGRSVALPRSDHELARVRRALAGLVATDRAVFVTNASFQLAHLGLVTSDSTHFRLGALAAKLALGPGQAKDELRGVVARLREPQPNPHWAVEAVLAEPDSTDGLEVKTEVVDGSWVFASKHEGLARELGSLLRRVLLLLAKGADSLVSLQALAAAATWSGLVAYAQVPALAVRGGFVPLLCEAGAPGELPTLRASSANALNVIHGTFEEWLRVCLQKEVESRFNSQQPTREEAHEYLGECKAYALSGGSKKTHQQLPGIFDLWHRDGRSAQEAMANALQDGLIAGMGDKPRKWFSAVGRHCGLVGPRRGYPARFRVEVALVPTFVLAGMADDDGESVPFTEWLERLASRFGVFFGPHAVCRQMVPRASEEELERNAADLAALLASLGLARRYSDGVTEVLNPLRVWQK